MLSKARVLAVCAVLGLMGCATGYQPHSFMGGYSDQKIDDNTVEVSFRGNGYTAPETVHVYLLRRCAEVTKQDRYDYFVLVNNQQPNEGDTNVFGAHVDNKYRSVATIKMFKGPKPVNDMNAYDAAQVLKNAGVAND
jgi:hypothetical protein